MSYVSLGKFEYTLVQCVQDLGGPRVSLISSFSSEIGFMRYGVIIRDHKREIELYSVRSLKGQGPVLFVKGVSSDKVDDKETNFTEGDH